MSATSISAAEPPPEVEGFLLQTLVQLLGLALRLAPGDEVRIESLTGPEQIGFSWREGARLHAMRIRSTRSMFLSSQIHSWAADLETGYEGHTSTLMLIGTVHPRLDKTKEIGQVALVKRLFDAELLLADAGEAVAAFRKNQDLPDMSPGPDRAVAALLASRLGDYCAEPRVHSGISLIDLLRQAVLQASAL